MNEQGVSAVPPKPPKESKIHQLIRYGKSTTEIVSILSKLLFYGFLVLIFASVFAGFIGGTESVISKHKLTGNGIPEIAILNVNGLIQETSSGGSLNSFSSGVTPRLFFEFFNELKDNPQLKAVMLRINSPGGSVTASEEIYYLIKKFKEETNIPVYASYGEVAASGGYYISLAADTIIADPTSLTGSIGVIASTYNIKELADTYGVQGVTVTSGENKAFLDPLQEIDPTQTSILKTIVDEAFEQFKTRVMETRDIDTKIFSEYADGRPLSGRQAEQLGFVDRTGNFYQSLEIVKGDIQEPDATVYEYTFGSVLDGLLGALERHLNPIDSIANRYLKNLSGQPAFLYLP